MVERGSLQVESVSSKEMLADSFTKQLVKEIFRVHIKKLGMNMDTTDMALVVAVKKRKWDCTHCGESFVVSAMKLSVYMLEHEGGNCCLHDDCVCVCGHTGVNVTLANDSATYRACLQRNRGKLEAEGKSSTT